MARRGRKPGHVMKNTCPGNLHTSDGKVAPGGVFRCSAVDASYYERNHLAERVGGSDGKTEPKR